jgi:hypothetical protein
MLPLLKINSDMNDFDGKSLEKALELFNSGKIILRMLQKMRTILSLLAAVCSVAACMAQPRIEWIETEHDFGAFSEDLGKVGTTFRYVNTGNEPLVIVGARANCGCTTPKYDTAALAPGDTAQIEVQYDATGRPGRFSKKIYIDTNTSPERSTLIIRGVVVGTSQSIAARYPVPMGKLNLVRATALLGDVNKSHLKVEMLNAYNTTTDYITPTVTNLPAWLTVTCTPSPLAPGEQMSFNFMVHPDRTDLYGQVADTIYVVPDSREPDVRFALPVIANIVEDFSKLTDKEIAQSPQATLLSERADLGKVKRGTELRATYQLRNDGKSPLLVRRVYCNDAGTQISVSSNKIKPGKRGEITVTYTPGLNANIVNLKITLITNDPLTPTQILRLTAEPVD